MLLDVTEVDCRMTMDTKAFDNRREPPPVILNIQSVAEIKNRKVLLPIFVSSHVLLIKESASFIV